VNPIHHCYGKCCFTGAGAGIDQEEAVKYFKLATAKRHWIANTGRKESPRDPSDSVTQ
jgi:hypothetical protein